MDGITHISRYLGPIHQIFNQFCSLYFLIQFFKLNKIYVFTLNFYLNAVGNLSLRLLLKYRTYMLGYRANLAWWILCTVYAPFHQFVIIYISSSPLRYTIHIADRSLHFAWKYIHHYESKNNFLNHRSSLQLHQ